MKMSKTLLGVSICLAVAGIAFASVDFNPATGTGFIGKGDVQDAFGWNDADLQANAAGVTFTYVSEQVYEVTVEWLTGPEWKVTRHVITQTRTAGVNASVVYETRRNKQDKITGFDLLGLGSPTVSGTVPAVGAVLVDPQTGNPYPTDHVVIAVEPVSELSGGGLYVNYGGSSVLLP